LRARRELTRWMSSGLRGVRMGGNTCTDGRRRTRSRKALRVVRVLDDARIARSANSASGPVYATTYEVLVRKDRARYGDHSHCSQVP
jgi:hypothetical protein